MEPDRAHLEETSLQHDRRGLILEARGKEKTWKAQEAIHGLCFHFHLRYQTAQSLQIMTFNSVMNILLTSTFPPCEKAPVNVVLSWREELFDLAASLIRLDY